MGLACVAIFVKSAAVVPLGSEQPLDVGAGLHDWTNKIGTMPQPICTNDEGSFDSTMSKPY